MHCSKTKRALVRLWPLLTVPLAQMAAYYGPRLLSGDGPGLYIALPMDERIPLYPPFIVIYILAFVQWTMAYLLLLWEDHALRSRFCAGHLAAETICFAVFRLLPTQMQRPKIVGDGLFEGLIRWIYSSDTPTNLLPSVHCMQSWLCLRMALEMRRTPRWYAPFTAVFTLLVLASTVFVKQHLLLDIPAGVLAAEVGLLLARKLHMERIFGKGEKP